MKKIILTVVIFSSVLICVGQNNKDVIQPSDKYLNRNDLANSIPRLKRAAEAGIAEAQYNYGIYFLEILKDAKTANEWFLKSAQQGFVNAQFKIAYSYAQGRGIQTDYKQAFYWMSKCAEQNDTQAMFVLAGMYQQGLGTEHCQSNRMADKTCVTFGVEGFRWVSYIYKT